MVKLVSIVSMVLVAVFVTSLTIAGELNNKSNLSGFEASDDKGTKILENNVSNKVIGYDTLQYFGVDDSYKRGDTIKVNEYSYTDEDSRKTKEAIKTMVGDYLASDEYVNNKKQEDLINKEKINNLVIKILLISACLVLVVLLIVKFKQNIFLYIQSLSITTRCILLFALGVMILLPFVRYEEKVFGNKIFRYDRMTKSVYFSGAFEKKHLWNKTRFINLDHVSQYYHEDEANNIISYSSNSENNNHKTYLSDYFNNYDNNMKDRQIEHRRLGNREVVRSTSGRPLDEVYDKADLKTGSDYRYESSSGIKYRYDLSKPTDRLLYGVDPVAQTMDRANPLVKIDRGLGQHGGGAE
jgi:hypothetical protein